MTAKRPIGDWTPPGTRYEWIACLERVVRQAVVGAISNHHARWLSPKMLGCYLGRDPKTLLKLVRAGKLPKPTYQLGPKSPRYDRLAVDAMLTGQTEHSDAEDIANRAIQRMRAEYENRPARARGRNST
jgi:hypothetical protein